MLKCYIIIMYITYQMAHVSENSLCMTEYRLHNKLITHKELIKLVVG